MDQCNRIVRVLTANRDTHNISVINSVTGEVVDAFDVGINPDGMAVTPDRKKVYVANSGDIDRPSSAYGTVSVIDLETNTMKEIKVGSQPRRIAITPDGRLAYVTNFLSDTVSVIDTKTDQVVETIRLSDCPFGIAISTDGLFAYVVVTVSRKIVAIDLATHSVLKVIPITGFNVEEISISADGKRVFVTSPTAGEVLIVDTLTNSVDAHLPIGMGWISFACSLHEKRLYTSCSGDQSVQVIHLETKKRIAKIEVGFLPRSLAITPNNQRVLVLNQEDNSVSVIDTISNTVCSTINVVNGQGPRFCLII